MMRISFSLWFSPAPSWLADAFPALPNAWVYVGDVKSTNFSSSQISLPKNKKGNARTQGNRAMVVETAGRL
jgi:hypothetical protein